MTVPSSAQLPRPAITSTSAQNARQDLDIYEFTEFEASHLVSIDASRKVFGIKPFWARPKMACCTNWGSSAADSMPSAMAGDLMSGAGAVQRFWYGWKM